MATEIDTMETADELSTGGGLTVGEMLADIYAAGKEAADGEYVSMIIPACVSLLVRKDCVDQVAEYIADTIDGFQIGRGNMYRGIVNDDVLFVGWGNAKAEVTDVYEPIAEIRAQYDAD